ncbi:MAG: 4Fe-4S dicluster domain-containing protein [Alphaproteobacteria bacterium]|nr:4Fe-4S dicluster domain-containing protein [Alphaproteobacteria bacterium]
MANSQAVIDRKDLDALFTLLTEEGYQVIGPRAEDGAILYAPVSGPDDLPRGMGDEEEGGHYRLSNRNDAQLFGHTKAVQGLKAHLYPARQKLWSAEKAGHGFRVVKDSSPQPRYAFIGVRACELAAMVIQDKVFEGGPYTDKGYAERRKNSFIAVVTCNHAGNACFCASQKTGPDVSEGFDLKLAEILDGSRHVFLAEAGSEKGRAVLERLPKQVAEEGDKNAAAAQIDAAAKGQKRAMIAGVADLLAANLESPHWEDVAKRCMSCGNCTMVCPTCFCSTVEDTTDLSGLKAERSRKWDSCFSIDYSYIHGGSVRNTGASRYRQWMTHKLSHWVKQFGHSGCVGCGRCIIWCPVGIDITAEAKAIGKGA